MNILHASGEGFPYSNTGGLADATAAVAGAQAAAGHSVTLVTPLYRGIRERWPALKPLGQAETEAQVWRLEPEPNLTVLFVDEPRWFERDDIYGHGDDAEIAQRQRHRGPEADAVVAAARAGGFQCQ